MFALTLPERLPNLCSAIRATLGQRQIRQSPGLALNAHSGNEWGKIPVLTGMAKVVTEAVTKKAITLWSNTVNELTAWSFKFVRKAFQQLLPHAANLVRWKRITDPVCHLCNNGQWQTNKHVLSNCNSTTALTRYTRRHNLVLEKITQWILETKSNDQIVFADVELSGAHSMGELFEPSVRPDLAV